MALPEGVLALLYEEDDEVPLYEEDDDEVPKIDEDECVSALRAG